MYVLNQLLIANTTNRWRSAPESSGPRNGNAQRRFGERKEELDSGSDWEHEEEEVLISESRFLSSSRAVPCGQVSLNPGRDGPTLRLCQSVRSLIGNKKGCHRLTRREVSQLVAAHASQLGELTVSDWTNLYTYSPSMVESDAGDALHFTEIASVVADLEAVLGKLKATKEEMQRRQLQQTSKSSDKTSAGSSNNNNNLCCICLDAPKSVLVLPCKHFCVCANCVRGGTNGGGGGGPAARTLRQCPVCRAAVQDIMHVYS